MMQDQLRAVLERPYADSAEGTLRFFGALVDAMRPRDPQDAGAAAAGFAALTALARESPAHRDMLARHIAQLFGTTQQVSLYTEAGILPNSGLFSELWTRAMRRILPEVPDPSRLKDCIDVIFSRPHDHAWLAAVPFGDKLAFWNAVMDGIGGSLPAVLHSRAQMIEAIRVLAARIGAMGVEPELVRVLPRLGDFESPFLGLGAEARRFAEKWKAHIADPAVPPEDERQLLVLVEQCRDVLGRARRNAASEGTSLTLTYLLVRLGQSLKRLERIALVLGASLRIPDNAYDGPGSVAAHWAELAHDLVQGETRRDSLREPFRRLTAILALRVTDNAGRTGEHYITTNREEYAAMWRSAGGAGFIVGFMALIKIWTSKLALAPLGYALLYSLNYSLGFIVVQLLHFTIATKQPAMTAATIAQSVDEYDGKKRDLHRLADLVVDMVRSQTAAILGNILVAMPTALVIALVLGWMSGAPFIDAGKAHHLLQDISPIASLAVPHAAIAGVCLFLAGLISGFFDNKASYDRIPERIAHLPWLRRLAGPARTDRVAAYIGANLGGLAGNFFFGIMLGSIGTFGLIVGLPIDIRHITFSSANFAFALVALDFQVGWGTIAECLLGLFLIGFTNLTVSFALAMLVALKARGTSLDLAASRDLIGFLAERARREPARFFVPPRA